MIGYLLLAPAAGLLLLRPDPPLLAVASGRTAADEPARLKRRDARAGRKKEGGPTSTYYYYYIRIGSSWSSVTSKGREGGRKGAPLLLRQGQGKKSKGEQKKRPAVKGVSSELSRSRGAMAMSDADAHSINSSSPLFGRRVRH